MVIVSAGLQSCCSWHVLLSTIAGFRLQISTGGDGWDSGVPKVRSFVFYSDNSVDTWVEDVERCVVANRHGHGHGSHGHSASASSVSHSSSGPTFSASKTPSPGPRSPANGAQQGTQHQNFSMFTDADFVETKVNFDSGVKLGGIRSDRGDLFDTTPLPTLAPPPRSSSSFLSAPSAAPPATSANANAAAFAPPVLAAPPQPAKNPAPVAPANPNIASLEDFLGLTASKPTQPTSTPATAPTYDFFATPASQSTSTAPAQHLAPANNMAMFAPFGTTPAANHPQPTAAVAPFNPFAMPTQPAAPTSLSAAYSTSGAYGGNMGQMGHGGAHYGQTAPFGVQPQQNAFNSTANSNSGMSYMFGAPSNNTAAQPKNNQVDFF